MYTYIHMKVFYTAAYSGKEKYQKYYDQVLKAIENTGVDVISPEKGNYKNILTQADYKRFEKERQIHYEAIRKGILWADVVIIENSQESFQLGMEAAFAMLSKKPVLCVSILEDFSEKIVNPYFTAAKYNEYTIEEIVTEFINKHQKGHLSERFNLFLSPRHLGYLEKISVDKGVNKSEYIRALIDEDQKAD
jgi:hypothetical protein